MKVACHAVSLVVLGLLAGAGCTTATTVEDGGQRLVRWNHDRRLVFKRILFQRLDFRRRDDGGSTGTTSGGGTSTGGGGPDLSCGDAGLPITAPAMLNLGGTVSSIGISGATPVAGATVEIFQSGGGASFGTATTDAAGAFSMTVPSGGTPLDAYFHATATGYPDVYWYPPAPFFFDYPNIPISLIDSGTLTLLSNSVQANQQPTNGQSGVEVLDCGGVAIPGAVVTTNPPAGKTAYVVGTFPSSTATSTDSSGTAFLFNLTPGPVSIGATLGSTLLRAHSVTIRAAGVLTETSVAP